MDVIQVTSNEAYGTGLQSQMITHQDQDSVTYYNAVNLHNACVTCDESAIYDIPLWINAL